MPPKFILYLSKSEADFEAFLKAAESTGVNFTITRASNQAALRSFLKADSPALIVADLSHAGFPTLKTVQQISKEHPSIPVLLLAGQVSREQALRFRCSGAKLIMEKNPAFYAQVDLLLPQLAAQAQEQQHTALPKESRNTHWLALNECFLQFGSDPEENINRLVQLCGRKLKAASAMYNRLQHRVLCTVGKWQLPDNYNPVDKPDGHICYDVILREQTEPLIIRNLLKSRYAQTDINVRQYQLQTYIGVGVQLEQQVIGSVCVVFRHDIQPTEEDLEFLKFIATAIGVEERRLRDLSALRESEERFRTLVETSFNGLCIHQDGVIIDTNQAFAGLLGRSREQLVNRPLVEFVAPESRQMVLSKIKAGFEGVYESRALRSDGAVIPVEVFGRGCFYKGAPARIAAVRDISRRVESQQEIREKLLVARGLNTVAEMIIREDQAPEILNKTARIIGEWLQVDRSLIYEVDFDRARATGLCEWLNPNVKNVSPTMDEYDLGLFAESVKYIRASHSYLESHIDRMNAHLLKDDAAGMLHHQMHIKSLLWFPLLDRDNGFYLLVLNQVTYRRVWTAREKEFLATAASHIGLAVMKAELLRARQETEQALRESEAKYRRIFENSRDVLFISTPEGKFIDVNPAGVELLGYPDKEELLSIDIATELYARPQQREELRRILEKEGYVNDFESVLKRKDGRRIVVLENIAAIRDNQGVVIAYEGIMRDITERQEMQKQLLQAHKMEAMGALASGIAHDFNNILAAILGNTEVALEALNPGSQVYGNIRQIYKATERAKRLVAQILSYTHQTELKMREVSIRLVVNETIDLLRASIPQTVEIRTFFTDENLIVQGDPTQIHQVLMNICSNAYQAMPELKGRLEIHLEKTVIDTTPAVSQRKLPPGEYARITIKDDGVGIAPHILERIFDPFFTTKAKGHGTGMGLSVAQGIIQRHHGRIDVESLPGKGTSVRIYLPCQPAKASQAKPARQRLPRGEGHILFVDDEEALTEVGRQILEFLGYTVTAEVHSIKALEAFRSRPDQFDLVITDQIMPSMTGLEMAREILSIRPETPIILMSGFSDQLTRSKALEMGIREYIMKPIAAMTLGTTIQQVLQSR